MGALCLTVLAEHVGCANVVCCNLLAVQGVLSKPCIET